MLQQVQKICFQKYSHQILLKFMQYLSCTKNRVILVYSKIQAFKQFEIRILWRRIVRVCSLLSNYIGQLSFIYLRNLNYSRLTNPIMLSLHGHLKSKQINRFLLPKTFGLKTNTFISKYTKINWFICNQYCKSNNQIISILLILIIHSDTILHFMLLSNMSCVEST